MTNKNIKAVCFDFGGVIELNEGGSIMESIAQLIGTTKTEFRKEYFKHNHLANLGKLSHEDMFLKVASVFGDTRKTKDGILSILKDRQSKKRINTDLVALFPKIRQQGLKVAIFSNHTSKLRETLKSNGIIELVDEVVISSEIGFQKPHEEAFQVLFEKLAISPDEVIFIDDTPESLAKSGEIGYTPILFKNNDQLTADLRNLGIHL